MKKNRNTDLLIIGAGVVGTALARELSRYEAELCVLEKGADICSGASKANSGIVHAGFDALPGTLKARLNVEGARMYLELCQELQVPYRNNGAMVLAFDDRDVDTLKRLLEQGRENGVHGMRLLSAKEMLALEPNANPEVTAALLVPESGITSPYEMTYALADHAAVNGAVFLRDAEALQVQRTGEGWTVETPEGTITCRILVNCAGAGAAGIHEQMTGEKIGIVARRGQYHLLDHQKNPAFDRTMFQCPTPMGKGVLISPTVHGNLLIGPTAEDIEDAEDTATTAQGLQNALETAQRTMPFLNLRSEITNFAGVRMHAQGDDFIIGPVAQCPHAYETLGIESPGLSAAPAIARMLAEQIAEEEGLKRKETWKPAPRRERPFNELSAEEQQQAIQANPMHGRIICRCEVVTEAEIRAAIARPVGARTIDGVKRRTRAGMGRCQGGFCSPRVAEILAEELGIPMTEVTKDGGNSRLLVGDLLVQEGQADE